MSHAANTASKDAQKKLLSALSQSFMDAQNAIAQSGRLPILLKSHIDMENGEGSWEVGTAQYIISCQMDITLLSSTSVTSSDTSNTLSGMSQLDIDTEILENVASVPDCSHSTD